MVLMGSGHDSFAMEGSLIRSLMALLGLLGVRGQTAPLPPAAFWVSPESGVVGAFDIFAHSEISDSAGLESQELVPLVEACISQNLPRSSQIAALP